MAIFTDIYDGTSLTRDNLFGDAQSSARRTFLISELANTREALNGAINQYTLSQGPVHPDNPNIQLSTVTAQHFSHDKAIGVATYKAISPRVDLNLAARRQTSERTGVHTMEWYSTARDGSGGLTFDSDGRPDGEFKFEPHPDDLPKRDWVMLPANFTVGVKHIDMPTILNNPPAPDKLLMIGRVNDSADGQFFESGTAGQYKLMFNGWRMAYLGSGKYLVVYSVSYNPFGWVRETEPTYNSSTDEWEISDTPAVQPLTRPVDFGINGGFEVHL